ADLIIINPMSLNFAPRFDWISQLVFNAQPVNVEWVFVDGRPLKKKGKLMNVNLKPIMDSAQKASNRIRQDLSQ
ncbi:MAG: amidohydrolase family protein, partial [Gammaproteobacteria bacterium]